MPTMDNEVEQERAVVHREVRIWTGSLDMKCGSGHGVREEAYCRELWAPVPPQPVGEV
jgi:hypothetical protein